MFKTCSDPDFNWVHCLCDSATWVVKEPGKPIGFFYSRLFDDALSPSGLGFAVDAFRIDEDGTLDDFYSDILWDYGAADELIAAYPNKFSCAVRCDGLNPYDIPTSWSQGKGERYRARDTVLAAVDMLTDEADEAGIDALPRVLPQRLHQHVPQDARPRRAREGRRRRGLALLGRLDRLLMRRRREGRLRDPGRGHEGGQEVGRRRGL